MQYTTKRRWIGRGAIFIGAFLAMVLGLAAALYTGTAPIKGHVESGDFRPFWSSGDLGVSNDGAICDAEVVDNALQLDVTKAYPGGSCTVTGKIGLGRNQEDGKIIGVDLTVPDGWTAKLSKGCGATVAASSEGPDVAVTITRTAAAGTGWSSGAFAVGDGVKVAPVSQSAPLECAA